LGEVGEQVGRDAFPAVGVGWGFFGMRAGERGRGRGGGGGGGGGGSRARRGGGGGGWEAEVDVCRGEVVGVELRVGRVVSSFVRCRLLPVFVSRLCEGREEKGGGCTNPSINTPVSLGRIRVMTVWMRCRGVG